MYYKESFVLGFIYIIIMYFEFIVAASQCLLEIQFMPLQIGEEAAVGINFIFLASEWVASPHPRQLLLSPTVAHLASGAGGADNSNQILPCWDF